MQTFSQKWLLWHDFAFDLQLKYTHSAHFNGLTAKTHANNNAKFNNSPKPFRKLWPKKYAPAFQNQTLQTIFWFSFAVISKLDFVIFLHQNVNKGWFSCKSWANNCFMMNIEENYPFYLYRISSLKFQISFQVLNLFHLIQFQFME